jgi:hypothetical protein
VRITGLLDMKLETEAVFLDRHWHVTPLLMTAKTHHAKHRSNVQPFTGNGDVSISVKEIKD